MAIKSCEMVLPLILQEITILCGFTLNENNDCGWKLFNVKSNTKLKSEPNATINGLFYGLTYPLPLSYEKIGKFIYSSP